MHVCRLRARPRATRFCCSCERGGEGGSELLVPTGWWGCGRGAASRGCGVKSEITSSALCEPGCSELGCSKAWGGGQEPRVVRARGVVGEGGEAATPPSPLPAPLPPLALPPLSTTGKEMVRPPGRDAPSFCRVARKVGLCRDSSRCCIVRAGGGGGGDLWATAYTREGRV